jgi:hypothetical protein
MLAFTGLRRVISQKVERFIRNSNPTTGQLVLPGTRYPDEGFGFFNLSRQMARYFLQLSCKSPPFSYFFA